jgi:hypothetical protein
MEPTFSVRGTGRFVSVCFTQFNSYTQSTTKLCIIDHSLTDLTAARIGADLVEIFTTHFFPLADGSHLKNRGRHLLVAANPHSPII